MNEVPFESKNVKRSNEKYEKKNTIYIYKLILFASCHYIRIKKLKILKLKKSLYLIFFIKIISTMKPDIKIKKK